MIHPNEERQVQDQEVQKVKIPLSNFIQIYVWKIGSLISGFLSLLIVIPHISSQPEIFGVYSFCIAFTLYFTYADIGFLAAGQKYAAEEFAKGNIRGEMEILGFAGAVLVVIVLPFSLFLILLALQPELLIKNISEEHKSVASSLLLIIAIATTFTIFMQRMIQSILSIRVKDYLSQRIEFGGNVIKIFSVLYFFRDGQYGIVEYFIFVNSVTASTSVLTLWVIRSTENYDLHFLLKSFRFRKKYFDKVKKLALSSLFLTLGWIVFYEIDLILIGQLLAPLDLAIYSAAFTLFTFLRSLYVIIYAPFYPRFNHFRALKDNKAQTVLTRELVTLTFPLCLIVTSVLFVSSEYFIILWVGSEYIDSVLIFKIMVLGTSIVFISIPGNFVMFSTEQHKQLYLVSIALPTVFIIGVFWSFQDLQLLSFAVFKTIALLIGAAIFYRAIRNTIMVSELLTKWALQILVAAAAIHFAYPLILMEIFQTPSKSIVSLALLISLMGIVIGLTYFLFIYSEKSYRIKIRSFFRSLVTIMGGSSNKAP